MLDVNYHLCSLFNDDVSLLVCCFRLNVLKFFLLDSGIWIDLCCYKVLCGNVNNIFSHGSWDLSLSSIFDHCRLCIVLKVLFKTSIFVSKLWV